MNKKEMTAWEKLEQAKEAIDRILNQTEKGRPDPTDDEAERMQQELILIVGTAAIFSSGLAFGDVHTVVPNVTDKEMEGNND